MYVLNTDVDLLVTHLDDDPDLAWLAADGPKRWKASPRHPQLRGRIGLWHIPSGPLPRLDEDPTKAVSSWIHDPFEGWDELRPGRDPTTPYFGAGHPGVYWLNLRTDADRPRRTADIGLSSFEWIGNRYRAIGSPAHPTTEKHWRALRKWVAKVATKVPRTGNLDDPGAEIWAFREALEGITSGVGREPNPF
jgi:hypothetical protein